MLKYLIGIGIIFGLGSCYGQNHADPKVEFVKVPHTKIVKESAPKPDRVEVVPQSCLDAIRLADDIEAAAAKLYHKGQDQLDIISEGREALANGDNTNKIEEKQRDLMGHTVGVLSDIEEAKYHFDQVREECEKETQ